MQDAILRLGGSTLQHGPLGDRIYLMDLDRADAATMPERLIRMGREEGYGKIFAKVPAGAADAFLAAGYAEEARVPGYYGGEEDGLFLAYYLDPARATPDDPERLREVVAAAEARAGECADGPGDPPAGCVLRACGPDDVEDMAALYGTVYASYPFPIHDPAYLLSTMRDHIRYHGAWMEDTLAALASGETCPDAKAVEMTDFATAPDHRGQGLAQHLLARLEEALRAEGFVTAYTIARGPSFGMNIVFARAGYAFGGTLINNTNIAGNLESMNVWHKPL